MSPLRLPNAESAKQQALLVKQRLEQKRKVEQERQISEEREKVKAALLLANKQESLTRLLKEEKNRILNQAMISAASGLYIMPLGKARKETSAKLREHGFVIDTGKGLLDKVHAGVFEMSRKDLGQNFLLENEILFSELANFVYLKLVDSHLLEMSDWQIRNIQNKIIESYKDDLMSSRLDKVLADLDSHTKDVRNNFCLANTNEDKIEEVKKRYLNVLSELIKEIKAEKKNPIRLDIDRLQVRLPEQISEYDHSKRLIGWWSCPHCANDKENSLASAFYLLSSTYGKRVLHTVKKGIVSSSKQGLQCTEVTLDSDRCYVKFNNLIKQLLVFYGYKVSKEESDSEILRLKIEFL